MIAVGNIAKRESKRDTLRIYVGRRSSIERARKLAGSDLVDASALGNPFPLEGEASRERVIKNYRLWLWQQIQSKNGIWTELQRIADLAEREDVELLCWCHPKACHADVIKACLEWMMRED